MTTTERPCVFLDRDGTLLEEHGYLTPAGRPRLYPWTIDALRLLKRAGYALVVVTNQGGIGRGLYEAVFVEDTHRQLAARFAAGGADIDGWHYCPHHPEALLDDLRLTCACRKPGTGMVDAAMRDICRFDLPRSWVVGDSWRDVQVGHATGARSILVRTGHGAVEERQWPPDIAAPTAVCDHLMAAAALIIGSAR